MTDCCGDGEEWRIPEPRKVTAFPEKKKLVRVRGPNKPKPKNRPSLAGIQNVVRDQRGRPLDEANLDVFSKLSETSGLRVRDISAMLGIKHYTARNRLSHLRSNRLARSVKEGKQVFYFLRKTERLSFNTLKP